VVSTKEEALWLAGKRVRGRIDWAVTELWLWLELLRHDLALPCLVGNL